MPLLPRSTLTNHSPFPPPPLPPRSFTSFASLSSLRSLQPTFVSLSLNPIPPWPRFCSHPVHCLNSPSAPETQFSDFDEDLARLLVLLPPEMRRKVESHPELRDLVEIVMDLGRLPLARFPSGDFVLSDQPITSHHILHATSQVGDFAADNRAGISRTLHRISAIRNRKGAIVGLTCRVGRAVTGSANLLRDLVFDSGSLLLIGPPGVGKTTIIREIARMLADDYKKRVMIVDTSNEIGGDGDIPHAGIGSARRLQVPDSSKQHKVLIEAVENHMPQVIVIDEIGTKLEAIAASTIAQRGIQLVATAHGVTIENLIMNPSLEMLVGGIQSVTLGDEEANRRGVQKTVLERKGPSTFTCGVEIVSKSEVRVHRCLEATVDALLAGRTPKYEVCQMSQKNIKKNIKDEVYIVQSERPDDYNSSTEERTKVIDHMVKTETRGVKVQDLECAGEVSLPERSCKSGDSMYLYVYGISETTMLQAIKQLEMDEKIALTDNISKADAFLALQSKVKKNSQIQAVTQSRNIPIHVTKTASLFQIAKALRSLVKEHESVSKGDQEQLSSTEELDALEEVRLAIEKVVIPRGEKVQLLPRPSYIIDAQIGLIEKYRLKWEKVEQGADVCLCVLPLHVDEIIDKTSNFEDWSFYDEMNGSTNEVTSLPLLPD